MKRLTGILVKAGVILLVVVALLISALRLFFPYLNDYRQPIVNQINALSGLSLDIGSLEGEWRSFGPSLQIKHLSLHEARFDLNIDKISLELDIWRSLVNLNWQFRELTFYQMDLNVNDNAAASPFDIKAKIEPGSLGDILLRRVNYFDLKDSAVSFYSPSGAPVSVQIPQLTWLNKRARHQAEGEISLSSLNDNYGIVKVILDLADDRSGLLNNGTIYLSANDINMKPWLSRWVRSNTGLNSANFSLSSWIRISDRQIKDGYLALNRGDIDWLTAADEHYLEMKDQGFYLTRRAEGWQLDSDELNIETDGNRWPKGKFSLYWQPENTDAFKQRPEIVRIRATDLQLEYLKPILPIFSFLDPERLAPWLKLDAKGHLSELALDIPVREPKQMRFLSRWQNVSWLPWQKLPGIDHFSGYANGNLSKGAIGINLDKSTLPYAPVFRAPLEVEKASGQLYWTSEQGQLKLWSDSLDVQARSLWINGGFSFSTSEQYGPWLSIMAGIDLYDARDAWRYYPQTLMGKNLVDYLTSAIKGGHAKNATLIFEGNPKQFPFAKNNGKFEVLVPLKEATLQFQPTWLPLTDLAINLDFVNNGLWMEANDASLTNIKAEKILASIPVYSAHKLYLDADVKGTGDHIYQYFKASPLSNSVAAALEQVQILGDVSGRLRLSIPLIAGDTLDAKGSIYLDGNDILIKPVNITLNRVKGSFDFTNNTLKGQGLNAYWLGQAIRLSFDSQKMEKEYRINLALAGNWSLSKLPLSSDKLSQALSGQAKWKSDINITLPNKGLPHYQVLLKSTVSKLSKPLQTVLANNKGDAITIDMQADGSAKKLVVKGAIGHNRLNSSWLLNDKQIRLSRGIWQSHGSKLPVLPKEEELIVNLDDVNGDYWLPMLSTQAKGSQQSSTFSLVTPKNMRLTASALTFIGQRWHNLDVKAYRQSKKATLLVKSRELDAVLFTANSRPWSLNIKHLYYNPLWPADKSKSQSRAIFNGNRQITSFYNWPSLEVNCDDCWFFGQSFGRVKGAIQPAGDILRLTNGLIDTGDMALNLSGEWRANSRVANSSFKGTLKGEKFDRSMRYFGIETPLKDAPYQFDFGVAWRGDPWEPQLDTLSGKLSLNFGPGQLANLSGGTAGQILSFVSITALLKKVEFDFMDTVNNGFDFSSITANSRVVNGVISTNSLLINGLYADIAMRGTVDLVRKRLSMEAIVAPELSATIGVATAFAINPVAGVALYAVSKALSPLWSKISFIRYRITGSIDNPNVSEVFRHSHKGS